MFEQFYGFSKTPFARDIPTDALYHSVMLDETLGRLCHVAKTQKFAVVTGDCGTGKTTTIRRFSDTLDQQYLVLYLADSKLTPRYFYKGLLEQLGFESRFYRGDAKRQLHREIEIMRSVQNTRPVVIVDEAHLLDKEMLEEVRFLLNYRMDSQSPMALILVGQSELNHKLSLQSYAAIRQRIDLQCRLGNYDRGATGQYIQSHLEYAASSDGNREIFTDSAIDQIFLFSKGTARQINKVCSQCLAFGAQDHKRLIDDHMVELVIQSELN